MQDMKLILEYTRELNVLYIEDDKSLLRSTSELLENFYLRLDTANNGQDGLNKYFEYFKEHNSYYDVIITDINMPILDGIEMSVQMIKANPMQSIIITTAHNEIEYLSSAIDLGISAFVSKPINNSKLMKAIYKTAQAISDHKFVTSHVDMMENLNMKLESQNRELLAKNAELEKSSRMLDTMANKEQLLQSSQEIELNADDYEYDNLRHEQIQNLIADDLEELKEVHTDIDFNIINIINSIDKIDVQALPNLVDLFSKYASILSYYNFFDELSSAMKVFSNTLNDNPLPDNDESIKNIFMLLESFMYVIGKWQEDLASSDGSKINALDASIISDMHTITNMWTQKEEETCEEDLDDIFDF